MNDSYKILFRSLNSSSSTSNTSQAPPVASPVTTSSAKTAIDVNHPYYIKNYDHPSMVLVTQLLTELNYHQWSRSVKLALSAKMKLGLIYGTLAKPSIISPLYIV